MNKTLKWISIVFVAGLLIYVGYVIVFALSFSFSFDDGKHYTTQDLIDNYNTRSVQIDELKRYINSVVPSNKSVDIEFDGDNKLDIFHIVDNDIDNSNWDLSVNSSKVDTLLNELGWTHKTLKTLKEKLDKANCISVKNGEPCNIGFQRSGMGKYYYNIFDKAISGSIKSHYSNSCTYIIYSDKVVLEYGGGAIGPQCFPTK